MKKNIPHKLKRKSKRQNPKSNLYYININKLLMDMNNDYVTTKTFKPLILPNGNKGHTNMNNLKTIAYGILRYNHASKGNNKNWYIQFNPLIQGELKNLNELAFTTDHSEQTIQDFIHQRFEENYPPTFEFDFYTDDVELINKHEIVLYDYDEENYTSNPFYPYIREIIE